MQERTSEELVDMSVLRLQGGKTQLFHFQGSASTGTVHVKICLSGKWALKACLSKQEQTVTVKRSYCSDKFCLGHSTILLAW
jgi:hypothetical protein